VRQLVPPDALGAPGIRARTSGSNALLTSRCLVEADGNYVRGAWFCSEKARARLDVDSPWPQAVASGIVQSKHASACRHRRMIPPCRVGVSHRREISRRRHAKIGDLQWLDPDRRVARCLNAGRDEIDVQLWATRLQCGVRTAEWHAAWRAAFARGGGRCSASEYRGDSGRAARRSLDPACAAAAADGHRRASPPASNCARPPQATSTLHRPSPRSPRAQRSDMRSI
jgi:hypothetical protein